MTRSSLGGFVQTIKCDLEMNAPITVVVDARFDFDDGQLLFNSGQTNLILDNVHQNRELVIVSILRDALIHSRPVTIVYEFDANVETRHILNVSVTSGMGGNVSPGGLKEVSGYVVSIYVVESEFFSVRMYLPDSQEHIKVLNINKYYYSTLLPLLQQALSEGSPITASYVSIHDTDYLERLQIRTVKPIVPMELITSTEEPPHGVLIPETPFPSPFSP